MLHPYSLRCWSIAFLCAVALVGLGPTSATAQDTPSATTSDHAASAQVYAAHLADLAAAREKPVMATKLRQHPDVLERWLVREMLRVFEHWYGTRWGLGAPQTDTPQEGKINCGMFVGRTLVDAGFHLNHVKLQRQPAELIIKSLAPPAQIKRWRHAPIDAFIEDMQAMGPGLYIIGLDFHVGYLFVRPDKAVCFIHASYITHTVLDEPAAEAAPIRTSKYRVVGKILQPNMLRAWVHGTRIPIRGEW